MSIDGYDYDGEEEEAWDGDESSGSGDDYAEEEQLALDDGEEQLPWLESDDDYEEEGVDTARILAFAVIGLLAIGLLVGGIWWVTQSKGGGDAIADGSTIEAPEGPYKTRPDDPGGKVFEGTGNQSFAVSEGQGTEGQLASTPSPQPSIEAATPTAAPAASGVGVQVGAFRSREAAESGWNTLVGQFSVLRGLPYRVIEGDADIGRVFRVQAVASSLDAANTLCSQLRAAGGSCSVKP